MSSSQPPSPPPPPQQPPSPPAAPLARPRPSSPQLENRRVLADELAEQLDGQADYFRQWTMSFETGGCEPDPKQRPVFGVKPLLVRQRVKAQTDSDSEDTGDTCETEPSSPVEEDTGEYPGFLAYGFEERRHFNERQQHGLLKYGKPADYAHAMTMIRYVSRTVDGPFQRRAQELYERAAELKKVLDGGAEELAEMVMAGKKGLSGEARRLQKQSVAAKWEMLALHNEALALKEAAEAEPHDDNDDGACDDDAWTDEGESNSEEYSDADSDADADADADKDAGKDVDADRKTELERLERIVHDYLEQTGMRAKDLVLKGPESVLPAMLELLRPAPDEKKRLSRRLKLLVSRLAVGERRVDRWLEDEEDELRAALQALPAGLAEATLEDVWASLAARLQQQGVRRDAGQIMRKVCRNWLHRSDGGVPAWLADKLADKLSKRDAPEPPSKQRRRR